MLKHEPVAKMAVLAPRAMFSIIRRGIVQPSNQNSSLDRVLGIRISSKIRYFENQQSVSCFIVLAANTL